MTSTRSSQAEQTVKHRVTFRSDIEGLRAVAVTLVVLGHAGVPLLAGGYVGVDVFFVISGFLITSLLLAELADTGRIAIGRFYARRMLRLLPAAATVLVATLVAAWLWLPATRFGGILIDALSSAFYFVNYRLAVQGTDYLAAEEAPSPLQHFWSLSVEEQFYLVWPLLLLLVALIWRRWGRSHTTGVMFVLAVVVAASLTASSLQTESAAPWAYFGIHTRAWELAIGALVAVAVHRGWSLPKALTGWASWAGLAAVVGAALVFTEQTAFPGWVALIPVAGTALVIHAGAAGDGGAGRLLSLRPLTAIGKVSYGWYLWHWPVLLIGPAALGVDPSVAVSLVLAVGALAAAVVSYHLIENPVRRHRWLTVKSPRGLGLGAAISAGMAVIVSMGFVIAPSTTGTGEAAQVSNGDITEAGVTDLLADGAQIDDVPVNLTPSLDEVGSDKPSVYPDLCHADFEVAEPKTDCFYGDVGADRTMVLFGDSHAAHWFPALEVIARDHGWRLVSLTKSACAAATVTIYTSVLDREYDECDRWRERSLDYIADLAPQMVIMPASDGSSVVDTDDPEKEWAAGFVESFRAVAAPGTELFHIADTPWFDENVPDCLATHLTDASQCVQSIEDALVNPKRRSMAIDALRADGVTVIDPLPWFCTDTVCPVIVENQLMFRDRHHISSVYARTLAPVLSRALGL